MPDPEQTPVITVDHAAEILGLSRTAAYRAVSAGRIPSLRYGRRLLVPTAELRRQLGLNPTV